MHQSCVGNHASHLLFCSRPTCLSHVWRRLSWRQTVAPNTRLFIHLKRAWKWKQVVTGDCFARWCLQKIVSVPLPTLCPNSRFCSSCLLRWRSCLDYKRQWQKWLLWASMKNNGNERRMLLLLFARKQELGALEYICAYDLTWFVSLTRSNVENELR